MSSSGFDWKALIGKVAPWIGTALGGPLAGSATQAVCSALGLDQGSSDEQIQAKLAGATPDQLLALKQADNDFAAKMQSLGFQHAEEMQKLAYGDVADARDREVKTGDHVTPRLLAGIMVVGFLFCVGMVISGQVSGLKDPSVAGLFGTLIGYVSSKTDLVYAYFFGSSSGSDRKTELLYNSAPTQGASK